MSIELSEGYPAPSTFPQHRYKGIRYRRVKENERERAFQQEWEEENNTRYRINYGMGRAQDLLVHERETRLGKVHQIVFDLTKRDRIIIATIIQWLGTNVGMGFLQNALKRCGYEIRKIQE